MLAPEEIHVSIKEEARKVKCQALVRRKQYVADLYIESGPYADDHCTNKRTPYAVRAWMISISIETCSSRLSLQRPVQSLKMLALIARPILLVLLAAAVAVGSPVHVRSPYSVKDVHPVPRKWTKVGQAPLTTRSICRSV
jgi:hypothetical protein